MKHSPSALVIMIFCFIIAIVFGPGNIGGIFLLLGICCIPFLEKRLYE